MKGIASCWTKPRNNYPGQRHRYSRDIHEVDLQFDHVMLCDNDFDLQREPVTRKKEPVTRKHRGSHRCPSAANIARYHTIELQINLTKISAVTIFDQGSIIVSLKVVSIFFLKVRWHVTEGDRRSRKTKRNRECNKSASPHHL